MAKKTDKEKYSKIEIEEDEEMEEKSIFSRTLEIPMIILNKKRMSKKKDFFDQAVRYDTKKDGGLSSLQVEERQTHNLVNKQYHPLSKSYLGIILSNIFTFFNILLGTIGIILICYGFIGDCFFLVIVFLNLIIGIVQEIKAKQTIDKLSLMNASEVDVIRSGVQTTIYADQLLLDDVYKLQTGKEIPADSDILEGEVEVNEALLTGESAPVKKVAGDYLLAGSYIVSGSCICKVDRIGNHNYVSQLQSKAKKSKKVKSVLLSSLSKIIKIISAIIIPMGIVIAINEYNVSGVISEMIRKTGGSLVAMIPSGLFLCISTTLAVSVVNLGMKKTMVQDSYSIESLARSNVICLDKTGTITDGTMKLEEIINLNDNEIDIETLMSSFLSGFEDKNVTTLALIDKFGINNKYKIIDKLPFSSARKLSAVQFEGIGTLVLGAPEFVTKDEKTLAKADVFAQKGYRVLLLAKSRKKIQENVVLNDCDPIALLLLSDHIREEAYSTIKWFNDNDVEVKIISGDNPVTVCNIAAKAGVINANNYISLDGLSNDEVEDAATKYTVFGRVSPEQKAILIKALKIKGKTVAMTGDGVNDILAMKQANCAIAMASGSEAAMNAAHLVLMDSNFASMPKIVEEGRKNINNIQRSATLFLMKTIFAITTSLITILTLFFPIDFTYPFNPGHLYVLEFAVIGIPSFVLALQPNTKLIKGNFLENVLFKSIPGGVALLSSVLGIMILDSAGLIHIASSNILSTMCALALSVVGLFVLLVTCYPFNKSKTLLCIGMVILAIALIWGLSLDTPMKQFYLSDMTSENILLVICSIVFSIILFSILTFVLFKISEKHNNENK